MNLLCQSRVFQTRTLGRRLAQVAAGKIARLQPVGQRIQFYRRKSAGRAARESHFRRAGLKKLYHSPLERAKRTAQISAQLAGIQIEQDDTLAEWRKDEGEPQVRARLIPTWEKRVLETGQLGALGLVTHGGPVSVLLRVLGLAEVTIAQNCAAFDHANPLPPAGAWLAERQRDAAVWNLSLVFIPEN